MKHFVYHTTRFGLIVAIMATVFVSAVTTSYADKSKRGISSARKAVPTNAIRYGTPTIGAVDLIVTAMGLQKSLDDETVQVPLSRKTDVSRDTVQTDSRIVFARATSDVFTARVSLSSDQPKLEIGIYNMLGKKMVDVYSGPSSRGEHEYTTPISEMPEGVYVCILQGGSFRRAAKFYLSR